MALIASRFFLGSHVQLPHTYNDNTTEYMTSSPLNIFQAKAPGEKAPIFIHWRTWERVEAGRPFFPQLKDEYPTAYDQYAAPTTALSQDAPFLVLRTDDPKVIVLIAHPDAVREPASTDTVAKPDSDLTHPDNLSDILTRFSALLAGCAVPVKELANLCLEDDSRIGLVLQCQDDVHSAVAGKVGLESIVGELMSGDYERGVDSEADGAESDGQETVVGEVVREDEDWIQIQRD